MLKSRILGENPCNIDKIFRKIKQFGFHARQAGGVCGIEMALWDLAGKAYNVPIYQMLGGKFRDKIRIYADTVESPDPKIYGERLKNRMDQGFTWLKMDLGIDLIQEKPGMVTRPLGIDPTLDVIPPTTSLYRNRANGSRCGRFVRLCRCDPRHHWHGCTALGRPLRAHRRQFLHQTGQGS